MSKITLRIDHLDGLRAILALFVVLTHLLDKVVITDSTLLQQIVYFLSKQGGHAVGYFFILSGFIIAYTQKNITDISVFITKRYLRIIPPLFASTLCILYLKLFEKEFNIFYFFIWVSFSLFITHRIWKILISLNTQQLKKIIFIYIIFQSIIFLAVTFILGKITLNEFETYPIFIKSLITFVTNISLTVFASNYLHMINGVIWTLHAEMVFYLLYPYILKYIQKEYSRKFNLKIAFYYICFYILLVLALYGIYQLALESALYKIFVQPVLINFYTGIVTALLVSNQTYKKKLSNHFKSHKVKFLSVLITAVLFYIFIFSLPYEHWFITTLFMGYIFLTIFYNQNIFLSNPFLVKLGSISYSTYLSHFIVVWPIHIIFSKTYPSIEFIVIFFITLILVHLVSYIFYISAEKPYFSIHINKNLPASNFYYKYVLFALFTIFIVINYSNALFKQNFGFYSYIEHTKTYAKQENVNNLISISSIVKPTQDNLGMILLNLGEKGEQYHGTGGDIIVELRENDLVIQRFNIPLNNFSGGKPYPIGINKIIDSKNKQYIITLMSNAYYKYPILLSNSYIGYVYFPDKAQLKLDKMNFLHFIYNKLLSFVFSPININIFFISLIFLFIFSKKFKVYLENSISIISGFSR